MGLFFSRKGPKIKVETTKKDGFSGWIKCKSCEEMIHAKETNQNLNCCPKCDHHYRISVERRIELLADEDSFEELFSNLFPKDSLKFFDTISYEQRIVKAKEKTNRSEAIVTGRCQIDKKDTALAIMDFNFMGGSMGSVVGEKLVLLIEYAIDHKLPLVIVCASGGARMQESIFSLMQMAKTSAALTKLHSASLPYISVVTNPTTGGVTASFASLGDIIIAEPKALVAFAGPRVVEQTIGEKLPEGAQKAEFLLEKGMIDCITKRKDLKQKISSFISYLMNNKKDRSDNRMTKRLKELLNISQKKDEKLQA